MASGCSMGSTCRGPRAQDCLREPTRTRTHGASSSPANAIVVPAMLADEELLRDELCAESSLRRASEGNELRSTSPILPRLSNGAELLRKAFHLNTGRSSQQVASRSSAPDETFAGSEVDPRSLV